MFTILIFNMSSLLHYVIRLQYLFFKFKGNSKSLGWLSRYWYVYPKINVRWFLPSCHIFLCICILFQSLLTRIVLSRDPDAKNGPWWWPFLLSVPAASFMAEEDASGAQAMHSTVWSWSRNSTLKKYFSFKEIIEIFSVMYSPCSLLN